MGEDAVLSETECPFCELPPKQIVGKTTHFSMLRDPYPLSEGHTLVVPKRHISSLFELSQDEWNDLRSALHLTKAKIEQSTTPDGYNFGVNDGVAAGQTVMHLHIHVIPRYAGDQVDPRGGIRWLFPDKAAYWQ